MTMTEEELELIFEVMETMIYCTKYDTLGMLLRAKQNAIDVICLGKTLTDETNKK